MSVSINQLRLRRARGPQTAFVLSGGGNQAVSQVGMLRALLERDILPDVVIGTSAGAFNGAAIAELPNPRQRRTAGGDVGIAAGVTRSFPGGRLSRAWNLLTRDDHLFSNQGLRALLDSGSHPPPSRTSSSRCG